MLMATPLAEVGHIGFNPAEGTGLSTTYSSSSSPHLNLTPKENPQSLTDSFGARLRESAAAETPFCGETRPFQFSYRSVTAKLRGSP